MHYLLLTTSVQAFTARAQSYISSASHLNDMSPGLMLFRCFAVFGLGFGHKKTNGDLNTSPQHVTT